MAVPTIATDPAPWAADTLTHLTGRDVEPIYSVHLMNGGAAPVVAYDVEVDYDTNREPYAQARFKLAPTGTLEAFLAGRPADGRWVEIRAGYQRGPVRDEHVIFYGLTTRATAGYDDDGLPYRQIEAASSEVYWDHPFQTGTWNISNSYSSVVQQANGMNGEPTRFHRGPLQAQNLGVLNTPTSGQLSAFRDMEIRAGENLQDWFSAIATTLGQRLRGDHRHRIPDTTHPVTGQPAPSRGWIISDAGRYPGTPALNLTGLLDSSKVDRSLDDYANFLEFTAAWGVGGATRQSQLVSGAVLPDESAGAVLRVRPVTVNMRPSGGTLTAADPVAREWAYRASQAHWKATLTGRAAYHLDCDQLVTWPDPAGLYGPDEKTGEICAITWHVDAGRMTLTVRPHTT